MVYPGIPVESTSRSSIESQGVTPAIYQSPSSSSVILPQQPVLYSYNAYCGVPQVQSTFPDIRRQPVANNYSLRAPDYRGIKSPKWHQKSRPRYKEYPQMAMQQPMPFPPPVVLYDPLQSHLSAPLPSLNPVYLQTPTCYSQPCPTDTFTYNSTVLPQPYYKPPEPPQFCIIHDRSPVQGQLSDQGVQQAQQPYYPVPTTYTKTRPCGNSTGYSTGLGSSCHGQSHSNFINYSTEKIAPVATIKTQHELLYPERNSLTRDSRLNESIFEMPADTPKLESPPPTPAKSPTKLDKYFDDSSNFDFTIEAEKMVSALCNTSHDLDRDEPPKLPLPPKPENVSKAYKSWYLNDFPKSATVSTQTSHPEDLQSPEVLRRTIYTGCTEMENLLNISNSTYRRNWLLSLSSATKIALSKSSTCFPIYLNDKAFGQDLMNSFLRISNGWLALDNYLNKQPNLSLSQKFDKDLQKSFKAWETCTSALLENITKNFKKLDASTEEPLQENSTHTSSFPGDVALYVNYNLFSNAPGPVTASQVLKTNRNAYPIIQTEQKPRWLSVARESKVRTKWTITENSKSVKDLTFPVQQIQSLMIPQTESTNIETTMSIWSPSVSSAPSYSSLYPNRSSSNLSLVSQLDSKKDASEGETINLSAWFASMRSKEDSPSFWETSKTSSREPRSAFDVVGTSKMDANRQLRTLKNMRMIQSAPWTANQILEDQSNLKRLPDDNPEDTRVYMKPGSYNVPKKKGQSKRCRKKESSSKKNCPQAELVPKPPATFFDYRRPEDEQPEIPEKGIFSNGSSSSSSASSQDGRRDVTWKAACASAELLLGALNVKNKSKEFDRKEDEDFDSSYEASEEDEDTFKSLIVDDNNEKEGQRTNVKTDSWLIRTLNNVAKNEEDSVKASDDQDVREIKGKSVAPWGKPMGEPERSFSMETSHTIAVMTLVDVVGKATYSETVRRFSTTTKPTSSNEASQKCLPGGVEASRDLPICSVAEDDGGDHRDSKVASEKIGKQKKGKGQSNDKGWSVWYSSRRKQQSNSLEPATLEILLSIYRILWRMDANRLFKFPGESAKEAEGTSNVTIENYRKVIKSPMFLETIGYKLKNQVYRKVEHVIKDFRKIVHNSKAYHKNDRDCTEKIEVLSKKLEELVDQHFSDDLQPKPNAFQISSIPSAGASPKNLDDKEISSTRRNPRNT